MKNFIKYFILTIIISAVLFFIVFFIIRNVTYLNVKSSKTNEDFNIDTYVSQVDKDNDGIDDQTDMLQSVREYLKSEPAYKSQYYAGVGYPDDGYGVCTDVVAFGMKGAGYNLMELVAKDIETAPEEYNIEHPDKYIDFRRVKNLKIFFLRNAISLTTDVSKIEEWQGGDIVIFKTHIGVVSDKRNKKGVPLLIHHANPYQLHYEEDILDKRDDIVGHYRLT